MPAKTEFIIDVPKKEINIPIGSTLFAWVIENLIKNAVDAIKGNGKIIISIKESNTSVIINIKDNGDGIDKKLIKNIFKPGVTSKQRGWGLGLSLSKRIIEEYHKGTIFILESKKNIGTTFSIHLPKLNITAT
jgi:signal transduction histidine kinase